MEKEAKKITISPERDLAVQQRELLSVLRKDVQNSTKQPAPLAEKDAITTKYFSYARK
jgi:hypothetical protein